MPLQEISIKKLLQLLSTCAHYPKPVPSRPSPYPRKLPFREKGDWRRKHNDPEIMIGNTQKTTKSCYYLLENTRNFHHALNIFA